MRVLIVYATTEGQSKCIALRLHSDLAEAGYRPAVHNAAEGPFNLLDSFDALIAIASVHHGAHQESMLTFIKSHLDKLQGLPGLFLSVSLSALLPGPDHKADVAKYIERFTLETGWQPRQCLPVAGAIHLLDMDYFRKELAKVILRQTLGKVELDLSHDQEFTEYDKLGRQVKDFLDQFASKSFEIG